MTTKTLPSTDAFANLAAAYAALTRELSASLLSRAGEEGMRRIDLANELRLSPSGITRLLDRLEEQRLVGKGACKEDARVSYAILTEAGLGKLRDAAPGHVEDIDRRIGEVLDEDEMRTLTELLGRIGASRGENCTPEE